MRVSLDYQSINITFDDVLSDSGDESQSVSQDLVPTDKAVSSLGSTSFPPNSRDTVPAVISKAIVTKPKAASPLPLQSVKDPPAIQKVKGHQRRRYVA